MTTLDSQFLRAVVIMTGFKPNRMLRAQAALLSFALKYQDFTAHDIPAEITEGSKHVAGAATGALIAAGLLTVVDRIKSPDPKAKGRKLDVLRLASGKLHTARAWLTANGFDPSPLQIEALQPSLL
jgi:hypothetical protein